MAPTYIQQNPRASAGSLSLMSPSPPKRGSRGGEPECPACEAGIPLITPSPSSFSKPTTYSAPAASISNSTSSGRARRQSIHQDRKPILRNGQIQPQPHSNALVLQTSHRDASPTRSDGSARTIIVPASSVAPHRPAKSPQYVSSSTSARSSKSGRLQYAHAPSYTRYNDVVGGLESGEGFPRRGRTKFPKKLVSKDAIEEKGYPYTTENDGSLVVLKALGRPEIEALVDLTEKIRRRGHNRKAVTFYEKALVREPMAPPEAPMPPPSDASAPITAQDLVLFDDPNYASHSAFSSSGPLVLHQTSNNVYAPDYSPEGSPPPRFEPLGPPGPSVPATANPVIVGLETPANKLPGKSPEEKLAKAAEKAVKADRRAAQKEYKAAVTGRAKDEHEAWKARSRADELIRKAEERERKERKRYMEKSKSHGQTISIGGRRVTRNAKGEVVVIKE